MRRLIIVAVVAAVAAVAAPAAFAATATPFGGATVSGGILTLVSDTSDTGTTNDASGATFTGTGVTTFSSITTLQTEFDVTDDDCRAGSPRFQVRVQTPSGEKNVFVYLGPTPSFTGCSQNVWIASGNLIGSTEPRYDTSQMPAGDAGLQDVRAGARARRLVSGDGDLARRRLELRVHGQGADRPHPERQDQRLDVLHRHDHSADERRRAQPGAGVQGAALGG